MFIIYSVYTLTWLTIEKHLVLTVNVATVIGRCIWCGAFNVSCVRAVERFPLFNEGRVKNYIERKKTAKKMNKICFWLFPNLLQMTPIDKKSNYNSFLFYFECGMSCDVYDGRLLACFFAMSGGKLQNNNNIRFRHRWGNNIGTAMSPLC